MFFIEIRHDRHARVLEFDPGIPYVPGSIFRDIVTAHEPFPQFTGNNNASPV